jgi:hypothetical protein
MLHEIVDILRNTTLVTCLVMTMLLFIEYINVATQSKSLSLLKKSPSKQVILSTLLGIIPGCIGGFATVSLYTHGIINFGALTASMITTMGDEAFVMFAQFPGHALLLQGILVVIALIVGFVLSKLTKHITAPLGHNHLVIHSDDHHHTGSINGNWKSNLRHISFQRALLIAGLLFFIIATFMGILEHSHEHGEACAHHDHGHDGVNFLFSERWLNILFSLVAIAMLVIIIKVSDHFLEEHLWGHVIKKHFFKIFLWTLGALTVVALLDHYIDAQTWVRDNKFYMLIAAILIGIIPASGPHLVFVFMFAQQNIAFSILLANTIMQDGHAGIPLLAESKKSFIYLKLVKLVLAIVAGVCGFIFGF